MKSLIARFWEPFLAILTIVGGIAVIWIPSPWSAWISRNGHCFATISAISVSLFLAATSSAAETRRSLREQLRSQETRLQIKYEADLDALREKSSLECTAAVEAAKQSVISTRSIMRLNLSEDRDIMLSALSAWLSPSGGFTDQFQLLREFADDKFVPETVYDAVTFTATSWNDDGLRLTSLNESQSRSIYLRCYVAIQTYSGMLRANYSSVYQGGVRLQDLRIDGGDYRERERRAELVSPAHDQVIAVIEEARGWLEEMNRQIRRLQLSD